MSMAARDLFRSFLQWSAQRVIHLGFLGPVGILQYVRAIRLDPLADMPGSTILILYNPETGSNGLSQHKKKDRELRNPE
jgi:hypothetical protein